MKARKRTIRAKPDTHPGSASHVDEHEPSLSINGCTISVGAAAPMNEHLTKAVEAVSRAAQANAEAISEIAISLRLSGGVGHTFGPAIQFGGVQPHNDLQVDMNRCDLQVDITVSGEGLAASESRGTH